MIDEVGLQKALQVAFYLGSMTSDDVRKIIEAYESARAGGEWQDISTAPKDGTRILLLDSNGCGSGYWYNDAWLADWDNYYQYELKATHWNAITSGSQNRRGRGMKDSSTVEVAHAPPLKIGDFISMEQPRPKLWYNPFTWFNQKQETKYYKITSEVGES